MRCEAGSKLRAGVVAKQDAPLVTRLKNAGAIVLGTTNTPEFLMAWETDNLLHGRTNSPWDLSRTPAAPVAAKLPQSLPVVLLEVLAAMAAVPSECRHTSAESVGLNRYGRIPASGHVPDSVGPFAMIGVVGPMARTTEDLKILFEVMQGPDIGIPRPRRFRFVGRPCMI